MNWLSLAHGFSARADLPVPYSLFYPAAGVALVLSFLLLAIGWKQPRLEPSPSVPQLKDETPKYFHWSAWADRILLTVLWIVTIVAAIIVNQSSPQTSIAPVVIFIIGWVGMPIASSIAGNFFATLGPYATIARLTGASWDDQRPLKDRGLWPAALMVIVFAWLELVYPSAEHIRHIGVLFALYTVFTVAGMHRYGIHQWNERAEGYTMYLSMFASISSVTWTRGHISFRAPLIGTLDFLKKKGSVPLLGSAIGTVSFDGFSATTAYQSFRTDFLLRLQDADIDIEIAQYVLSSILFAVFVLVASLLFAVCSFLAIRLGVDDSGKRKQLISTAPSLYGFTLIPIALAYIVAHYYSYLVLQGQQIVSRVSDPFGQGWNLFGTADYTVTYAFVTAAGIWYVQVFAIVVGHVAGLVLAHDQSLRLAEDGNHRRAIIGQLPMLVLMLIFTLAGLWFLSEGLA